MSESAESPSGTANMLTILVFGSSGQLAQSLRDTKKNKGHFLNKSHNTRYEWFKYFFTEHKNLIKKIIKENKIFFNNLYVFKAYYFIFNILKNIIKRIIGYRQLITFIRRFANRFINNDQIKIFKQLKLDEIIKPEDLLRKKM